MVAETEEKVLKHYRHKRILVGILYAAIILASGIAIGAGGTILLVKHRVIWIGHHPHKDIAGITKEISEKYGLNQQQTKQVEEIINKVFQQKKLNDEEMNKRREADTQIMIAEMNSVLTPEQFARWNKDFQEMREKFQKRFKK